MLAIENTRRSYSLSPLQEGLLFHSTAHKNTTAYIGQLSYKIAGNLQVPVVEQSFNVLFQRHHILRTLFNYEKTGRALQVIQEDRCIDFSFKDIRTLETDERKEASIRLYKQENLERGFDLGKDVLMRICIFQLDEYRFELVWSWHHIIMDGWSLGILQKEFIDIYNAIVNQKNIELPAAVPYYQYINWLEEQDKSEATAFWSAYLQGYEGLTGIPKNSAAGNSEYMLEEIPQKLGKKVSNRLFELGKKNRVTLNNIMLVLWGIILAKYNRCNDVVFGTVVSGRSSEVEDVETIVGLFINSTPVRIKFNSATSFRQLLLSVKDHLANADPYQSYQLAEIQSQAGANKQLFDHLLVFENYPLPELESTGENDLSDADFHNLSLSDVEFYDHNHYDFNLVIIPGEEIELKLSFNANAYHPDYMKQLGKSFAWLAEQVIINEDIPVEQLQLLTAEERTNRLAVLKQKQLTPATTLVNRFEDSVQQYAGNEALFFEGKSWSYAELNATVNRLAHHLRNAFGVKPNDLVAVLLERSDKVVISILSVLKAGGAYLLIDPEYPDERVQFILGDAASKVIITQTDYLSRLADYPGEVFTIDFELNALTTPETNPEPLNDPTDLAYCLYTSGTTGFPKGSLIEHHSMVNLVNGLNELVPVEKRPLKMAVIASVVFDPFGKQLFLALLNGHSLYLVPGETKKFAPDVWNYFARHNIQLTDGTPAWLQTMLNFFPAETVSLEYWLIGGEVLPGKLALSLHEKYKKRETKLVLINEYGLTECCVDNCCYQVNFNTLITEDAVAIGRPLLNNHIVLLDEALNPVPDGVSAEICIAGDAVGRGYLNQAELTHTRFIEHPEVPGVVLFKTGDLGKWLADGTVKCLGRIDRQIKLRGYRIELGEIENVLRRNEHIKEVLITDKKDAQGDVYLAAYFIPKDVAATPDLKGYLKGVLPEYMVPSFFISLESFPLTINGKIDKAQLPDPQKVQTGTANYVAPRTETEVSLIAIWQSVLSKEKIGVNDNFFELGGHSLKAIQVLFNIQKEFRINMSLTSVFTYPTPAELAAEVDRYVFLKEPEELNAEEDSNSADEILL